MKSARAFVKLLTLIRPNNLPRQIIISDAKLWKILLYTELLVQYGWGKSYIFQQI